MTSPAKPLTAARRYEKWRLAEAAAGRPLTIDGTGTYRRLRALVTLGWTYQQIGSRLGVTGSYIYRLAKPCRPMVLRSTAERVNAVYDEMSMQLPPNETTKQKRDVSYSRTVARKHRWDPPLAWEGVDIDDPAARPDHGPARFGDDVDEVAVLRALDGDITVRLTRADRFEIVRRARARGWSLHDIEARTGITKPERYLPAREEAA